MKRKTNPRTESREQIVMQWEELWCDLTDLRLDVEKFKEIFLKTWRYFMEYVEEGSVDRTDLALYKYVAMFAGWGECPTNVKQWEFDACSQFAEGLLDTVIKDDPADKPYNRAVLAEGTIAVEVFIRDFEYVHIDKFDEEFAKITQIYWEDCAEDDEDDD